MTTETKPKKSRFLSSKKRENHEGEKPATVAAEKPATAEATPKVEERKYEPNPATAEARERINETGRAAAYAAEALVPSNARNREGQVAKVRRELQTDAVGDLIAKGKIKLPDRSVANHPASHAVRAQRSAKNAVEIS